MITNCDIPFTTAVNIDVIVPVHANDVVGRGKQWYTRVLYNRDLPFKYSFIIDTHVFPCYNTTYKEIFKRFKESNVDIAVSNRMNVPGAISGGAVLTRHSEGSRNFWKHCIDFMQSRKSFDDQAAIGNVLKTHQDFVYHQLSSNWFFASHGIMNNGRFRGSSKCYRSSVVVTGPVQWIHGGPEECPLINGKNNEIANTFRAYFKCRKCQCKVKGPTVVTSHQQLASFAFPNSPPDLLWINDGKRDGNSLFWN